MRPVFAVLADTSHRLPLPGVPGAIFPAEGRLVDADDLFWFALLADGSLREGAAPAAPTAPTPAPEPAETL